MNNPKEADEAWIFLEFAAAAGLCIGAAPTKREPPMPDLECVIDDSRVLFELGEILESDLGEGIAYSDRQAHKKMEAMSRGDNAAANAIQTAGYREYPANASLERILRQKLVKRYETNGCPSNLLLFYDQQPPWGPFDYLDQWQNDLATLIAGSVFQRVWIFYLQSATLIGYLESAPHGTLRAVFDWQFHLDLHGFY
jgi:hypothetical protein